MSLRCRYLSELLGARFRVSLISVVSWDVCNPGSSFGCKLIGN